MGDQRANRPTTGPSDDNRGRPFPITLEVPPDLRDHNRRIIDAITAVKDEAWGTMALAASCAARVDLVLSDVSSLGMAADSIGLLAAGTVGLLLGRRGPGIVSAVVQDFQLMMIGPVWLLSILYKRFGVPF